MSHTADSSSIYRFASKRRFVWRHGPHTEPQFRVQWLCPPRLISSHGLVRIAFSDVADAKDDIPAQKLPFRSQPKRKYEKRNEVTRSVAGSVAPTNEKKNPFHHRAACVCKAVVRYRIAELNQRASNIFRAFDKRYSVYGLSEIIDESVN